MDIKGTTAIVTGGASGMGAATAKMLALAGAKVTLLDLNTATADIVAKEIQGLAIHCDITSAESVEKALKLSAQQQGPARICINCAGILSAGRLVGKRGALPLEDFRKTIEINLIGTFNVMRLAAEQMAPLTPATGGERGIIINTASIAAFEGQIGQTAYSASKAGVVGLTLPAARDLALLGIRVNTIAPGLIDTPMFDKISTEARQTLVNTIPFPKRLGYPEEYAKLVLHIIENQLLNGEVIRLDGALRLT